MSRLTIRYGTGANHDLVQHAALGTDGELVRDGGGVTGPRPGPASGAEPAPDVAEVVLRLQSEGLRLAVTTEGRKGGAGPSDVGMIWVEDLALTLDTDPSRVQQSPFELRDDEAGPAIYEHGRRVAGARTQSRPRYYDLETSDGVPYWKIALLHLDSLASTVLQTCAYWGNEDQCTFCGIGVTLEAGRTIAKKTPAMLAEVAVAARDLDGAVDVTLTTGSTRGPDRGALYVGRCGQAVKRASGLPVEIQFEPPEDLDVIDQVADMGAADTVGIHVETFDPAVLARVAPAKARTGIEHYFAAWSAPWPASVPARSRRTSSSAWARIPSSRSRAAGGPSSSACTRSSCPSGRWRGSLMADWTPPDPASVEQVARRLTPFLRAKGIGAETAKAGCSRCNACSPMAAVERSLLQIGPKPVAAARA